MLLGTYLAGSIASWLTERKNGLLIPKRHQSKHLEVVLRWFRTKVSAEGICESRRTRHFDSSADTMNFGLFRSFGGGETRVRSAECPSWLFFKHANMESGKPCV
jgi:hypothetical protein